MITSTEEMIMSDGSEHKHDGLEPKLTVKELKERHSVIFTAADGRQYHAELPGLWSNAKVAATDTQRVCRECRDSPHFDTDGYNANRELGRRIQAAFKELKADKGFILTWRVYPDKDHPRWKVADGCGCGCSCSPGPADEESA
jgi:hypothetical protein